MTPDSMHTHKIVVDGHTEIFTGNQAVVENALKALHDTFYFVAGNAKPITDPFPFTIVEI